MNQTLFVNLLLVTTRARQARFYRYILKKREALLQLQLHVLCVCVSAAKTVAVLANSFATLRILPDGR
jgi:hypothetical protein